MIKWSCDFMIGSPSRQFTTLLIVVVSDIVVVEINVFDLPRDFKKPLCHCGSRGITYLTCQMTLQDQAIKKSSDFME